MIGFPLHRFTLNGSPVQIQAPPLQSLLDVLRDRCGLCGTKCACGEGECGACTVLVDDQAVMSCLVPVVQIRARTCGRRGPGPGARPRRIATAVPGIRRMPMWSSAPRGS